MQQLLLSKRLFIEASSYADRADPVAAGIAISMFQDSVELYLLALITKQGIPVKERDGFASYVENIQKANISIPYVAHLHAINKARVGFKHSGNLPDIGQAKKFNIYVEDFLRQAMSEHFEVEFDGLSLVDLISDNEIKAKLKLAEAQILDAKYNDAAESIAIAKGMIFNKMDNFISKVDTDLSSADEIFNRAHPFGQIKPFHYLEKYLKSLRESTLVSMFQISLKDYAFIKQNFPVASQALAGNWYIGRGKSSYTEDECRQAIVHIVNICIKLEIR